jgi:pSer/pThr/pTyr-binding forkhead associated (FHA) protein
MADEDTTRIVTRKNLSSDDIGSTFPLGNNPQQKSSDDDSHTKIFRPSGDESLGKSKLAKQPVVGWLVIINGPGRGESLTLGYGVNRIGRSSSERVSIDFGDEEISREKHALLTYDPKGRKFYLQHGGGVNLTYIGNTPVLQTMELNGGEVISIGKTELSFVPFCGQNFDW